MIQHRILTKEELQAFVGIKKHSGQNKSGLSDKKSIASEPQSPIIHKMTCHFQNNDVKKTLATTFSQLTQKKNSFSPKTPSSILSVSSSRSRITSKDHSPAPNSPLAGAQKTNLKDSIDEGILTPSDSSSPIRVMPKRKHNSRKESSNDCHTEDSTEPQQKVNRRSPHQPKSKNALKSPRKESQDQESESLPKQEGKLSKRKDSDSTKKRTSPSPGTSNKYKSLQHIAKQPNLSSISPLRKKDSILQQAGVQYPTIDCQNVLQRSPKESKPRSPKTVTHQIPKPTMTVDHKLKKPLKQPNKKSQSPNPALATNKEDILKYCNTSRSKPFYSFHYLHCFRDQTTGGEQKEAAANGSRNRSSRKDSSVKA